MLLKGPSAPGFQTKTVFSVEVYITDNDGREVQIGTIKTLRENQDRTNTPVGGIGIGDRILEIVPGRSKYTITVNKFEIWKKPFHSIFGYHPNVRMLAEMQRPFDIKTFHINPNVPDTKIPATQTNGNPMVDYTTDRPEISVTIYKGCVFSKISKDLEWGDESVIIPEADIDITSISSAEITLPALIDLF